MAEADANYDLRKDKLLGMIPNHVMTKNSKLLHTYIQSLFTFKNNLIALQLELI